MQQQREELERLLSRRLQEQEDQLNKQHHMAMDEKELSIQQRIQSVVDAQNAEHQLQIERLEIEKDQELNMKYQSEYMTRLHDVQIEFTNDLEDKVHTMEALRNKIQELENALQNSRNFESGSVRAHRLSAAALAFAEKLETSESAIAELNVLKV